MCCCSTRPAHHAGQSQASAFAAAAGVSERDLAKGVAGIAGRRDARGALHRHAGKEKLQQRGRDIHAEGGPRAFLRQTRMSGIDWQGVHPQGRRGRHAPTSKRRAAAGRRVQTASRRFAPRFDAAGGRRGQPCAGASSSRTSSRAASRSAFANCGAWHQTVMITGDNRLTAASPRGWRGRLLAEATPEAKLKLIRRTSPKAPRRHDRRRHHARRRWRRPTSR